MRLRKEPLFLRCAVALAAFAFFLSAQSSTASTTDGTIDAASKYGWGDRVGWVNFGTSGGNVHITDSAVTGYAWSENFGWINLGATQSGVTNNGEGDLSGYAWGEKLGWIDFNAVSVSSGGVFAGTAIVSSSPTSSIIFDCSNCGVKTDWRPASARGGGGSGSSNVGNGNQGSGGGTGFFGTSTPPVFASATPPVVIRPLPAARPPVVSPPPAPRPGRAPENIPPRRLTVFDRIRNFFGFLFLRPRAPEPLPIAKIVPKIPQTAFQYRWNLLPVKEIRAFVFAPLPREFVVLKEQFPQFDLTLRDVGVRRMTDVQKLVNARLSLPGLPESAGIESGNVAVPGISEGGGIKPNLTIPEISRDTGLPFVGLTPGRFALPPGIPLANMETKFKQQIPREVVFARSGGERIDFPIKLALTKQGTLEKRIRTVVRSSLRLVVRPDAPVASVKGYLLLKTRLPDEKTEGRAPPRGFFGRAAARFLAGVSAVFGAPKQSLPQADGSPPAQADGGIPLQNFLASAFFTGPAFAELPEPVVYVGADGKRVFARTGTETADEENAGDGDKDKKTVEERFALLEFEYTDPDGDGVYTADVQAPGVDGEYEIITLISYKDPELGTKEIRLIAIIDPEGYVFERQGEKELRVPGAVVTLYAFDASTGKYATWPARDYHQENPQVTDVRGTYAFLVPQGYYHISVSAPGYSEYQSKPFEVSESNEVHMNIELQSPYGWLRLLDWKVLLLILISLLLGYNFYRDRKRER